jgi:putative endonuclease
MYYVYILTCSDGSLYTGITTCVERRLHEHNTSSRGAKYTRSRRPTRLAATWSGPDRSWALREEARIKRLSRKEKLNLIDTFVREKQS